MSHQLAADVSLKRKRTRDSGISQGEMNAYRELIQESIGYHGSVRERPFDAAQLDEMSELMVEAVCSKRKNLRVAGNDFPRRSTVSGRIPPRCGI